MACTPDHVAIIIPHYRDVAGLTRCLAALWPQVMARRSRKLRIDVILVDNDSGIEAFGLLSALAAQHHGLHLVTETRKGAAHARNRGVAETQALALFFLDCDCVPASDWLDSALAVAGQAALVGGTVTVFDETPPPRSGAEAFETVFAFDNRRYIEEMRFSVTANLLTRRDVFDAVGGFRPGLSEDLDWCQRAVAAGFALVHEDRLRVAHPTRSDWPALRRKWRRLTEESWGLKGRGPAARAAWAGRALMMPLSVLAHAPRVLRARALRSGGERWRALVTLARLRLARGMWMLGQAARKDR